MIEKCWKPRPACCACCPCSRRGATGIAPNSLTAWTSPPGPSATTWPGCARSAIRSRRGPAWPAATGSARAVRCPRCCSMTRRRWPSRSGCGSPPTARSPGSRRPRSGPWPSYGRYFRPGSGTGSAPSPRPQCRCRPVGRRWIRTCSSSSPVPAGTTNGSGSTTGPTRGRPAAARWSRTAWWPTAGAGTWSPGTRAGTTGVPSGSTGSSRGRRLARASPRGRCRPTRRSPPTWPAGPARRPGGTGRG